MLITYVSHASLAIEAGGVRCVTDPWFNGAAYVDQWNVFPKPVDTSPAHAAEYVLISHGHEDHLHAPTLEKLAPGKTALYPYYWYDGTAAYLQSLGFPRVLELRSERTFRLAADVDVTFVVNGQDSVIVVEHRGRVLVNVNDALHSSEPFLIDHYVARLKKRWPKIDFMFCGFGGASCYPNAIHGPGKDDLRVAQVREQLFAHNFCRIAHGLRPRFAVPFAADFVLLAPQQRWINDARMTRADIAAYSSLHFGSDVEIPAMYPGDQIGDDGVIPSSPHRRPGGDSAVADAYPEEVSAFASPERQSDAAIEEVREALRTHLPEQLRRADAGRACGLLFSVVLQDAERDGVLNVEISRDGRRAQVERSASPLAEAAVVIETVSPVLRQSLSSDWGGDAIIIGYGADAHVRTEAAMRQDLGRFVLELLVRHPRPAVYAARHPLRAVRYVLQLGDAATARLKRRIEGRLGRGKATPLPRGCWMTSDAKTLRRLHGLPDWNFGEASAAPPPRRVAA